MSNAQGSPTQLADQISRDGHTAPIWCHAAMNYVHPDSGDGAATQSESVVIYDGRQAALPDWQSCGFELMTHNPSVTDWQNEAQISGPHYEELAALARQLTGADHALISSHIKRDPEQAAIHADLGPISYVHSDFAPNYRARMQDFYRNAGPEAQQSLTRAGLQSKAGAEVISNARRMMIVQFWRNIGPPRMDLPLALCDARTVRPEDAKAFPVLDYAGGGFDFETLGILPPKATGAHRWYAFPDMQANEVIFFRTYDSALAEASADASGSANPTPYWTPHSAFADPAIEPGKPSRRSIEIRATCLFE